MEQVALFVTSDAFDPFAFDKVIIGFSGGKDSVACLLHCIELGIPKDRIELWHHEIDDGDTGQLKMDWPSTHGYVKAFANALGIPLYFSWREGGFSRELLRENALTAPTLFETPDGLMKAGGIRGTPSTRRKFPQQSANLSTRWCSASLKIDICSIAIANQARFNGKRTCLVTGERAEESSARAKYEEAEAHKTSNGKRMVWQWRPVHKWSRKGRVGDSGTSSHPRTPCLLSRLGALFVHDLHFRVTVAMGKRGTDRSAQGHPDPAA